MCGHEVVHVLDESAPPPVQYNLGQHDFEEGMPAVHDVGVILGFVDDRTRVFIKWAEYEWSRRGSVTLEPVSNLSLEPEFYEWMDVRQDAALSRRLYDIARREGFGRSRVELFPL